MKQYKVTNFSWLGVYYVKISGPQRRFLFWTHFCLLKSHFVSICFMYKKLKIEENQLGTLCYDTDVDSFQQSPTSHEETKHSTWALHHISWMFSLLICQFIIILVQIWCSCSIPVFIFLEYWSLSSFFVITNFFFIVVNLGHLDSVTLSCCGCDSGLNWTFEMCSACLNILYLTVCV